MQPLVIWFRQGHDGHEWSAQNHADDTG